MQVEFTALRYITGIATQCGGWSDVFECVASYYIYVKSSSDGNFVPVCLASDCPGLFPGNADTLESSRHVVVHNDFESAVQALIVKLEIRSKISWFSLRWEVYGCAALDAYRSS